MREREKYEKRVGTVVDARWRVDSLLGWGSTSAVYAATHRNGHRAALKILHQSLCSDPVALQRFMREAGIANAIKHRAIVTINDDGVTDEGCAYLVVELLDGDTLEAMRERAKGRLSVEDLAPIAEELLSAIAAVHAAGVVHRDLKPQNVFITKKGELKLLDFGTARIFDRAAGSPLSVQGLVIGTPAFMSPEQARGARSEVDAKSDVWSLGAMMFTLLSGELVHAGKDAHQRLLAAASNAARPLSTVAPSVDDRVAAVIDRALAYSKEDRYPDVRAMRIAFRQAVVAAVPTMRDQKAFADVTLEDPESSRPESSPGTVSLSDPTRVMAAAAAQDSAPPPSMAMKIPDLPRSGGSGPFDVPAVSSTQDLRKVGGGIPLPALVLGLGAIAAVLVIVFFFVGDDGAKRAAASAAGPPPAETTSPVAHGTQVSPTPSFIVIEAPDVPGASPALRNAQDPKKLEADRAFWEAKQKADAKAKAKADAEAKAKAKAEASPETTPETTATSGGAAEAAQPKNGVAPQTSDIEPP